MKHLFTFFLILSFSWLSAHADDNETINNICIGEQIEELQYISNVSANTSHTQTGTLDENSAPADNIDYFYFTPSLSGDITFSFTADQRVNVDISIINCGGDEKLSYGNVASGGSDTFAVNSTDTVYIKVVRVKDDLTTYNLNIDFAPASKTYDCSNPKEFSVRKSIILPGDMIAIGNSNICADTTPADGVCDTDQIQRNDRTNIIFINSTSSSDINASDTSENTSSAQLTLPAGATVAWAGLYWQGEVWNIKSDEGWLKKERAPTIKFKTPNGTYQDLVADEFHNVMLKRRTTNCSTCIDYYTWRYEEHYQGFKDVTDLVTQDGNYSVANIQATIGKLDYPGVEAAWSLQVIYEYPDGEPRSISINDGFLALYSQTATEGDDYATEVGCSTGGTNTGIYGFTVSFDVTGFLTPKLPGFDTDMSIFLTESDPDGANADEYLTIAKKDGSTTTVDGPGAWNYEITNKDGSNNTNRSPAYIYPIGMTIQNYTLTDALDTEQSSTEVTFSTGYDRLLLGVIGFATDLRKPVLCYDYSYKQFDQFFTEENNGTQDPRVYGPNITAGELIDVGLYIQNKEESDVVANNIVVDILDINTSQATYINETTRVTEPGSVIQLALSDSDLNVSSSYIRGIDTITELTSLDYFYTYYSIDPSVSSIDMPINARISYDLTLPTDSGPITIPYTLYINNEIELCTSAYSSYTPKNGTFNVAHKYELDNGGYYNIPTQVARKVDEFVIVGYDPASPQTEANRRTSVAIELIDIGGYQSSLVACDDPASSISPRIWFNTDGNVSRIDINKALIDEAIADGRSSDKLSANPITSAEDFFSVARQNTAFRISYNLADQNGSLIELSDPIVSGGVTSYNVLNFTELIGINDGKCLVDVDGNPTNEDLIPQMCNNAGGAAASAMTEAELAVCLECVYGYNVEYDCSRDNFAIRPEAFKMQISDNGQSTTPTDPISILPTTADISAGYNYRYDINATSHVGDGAVTGYTRSYLLPGPDFNITAYWRPDGHTVSGCNDTNDVQPLLFMVNGAVTKYTNSNPNLGRYELEMRDNSWTEVDQAPSHHTTSNYRAGDDCKMDSSAVPDDNVSLTYNNIGCNISSSHTNNDAGLTYSDYEITVHPYDFNISTVTFNKGINKIPVATNDYVYMNNVIADSNMSVRYEGTIRAVGADNTNLTNFVADCFAEDVNLDIVTSTLPSTPLFNYRLRENNTTSTVFDNTNVFSDTSGNNGGAAALTSVVIPAGNFTKGLGGVSNMQFNLNFDRTVNTAINPFSVVYGDFNVSCSTPADCQSYADMTAVHLPNGGLATDSNVTHIYGRLHTPRHRVADPDPGTLSALANIPLYYEFYCESPGCNIEDYNTASTLPISPIGLLSPDDVRWYIQAIHNVSTDGNATLTQTRNGTDDARFTGGMSIDADSMGATYVYDGAKGYPYKATIELNTRNWLLYNRYNPAATVNDFELEFTTTGNWSGKDASGMGLDGNSSTNVNRRVEW